jgi:hypothetical protein
MIKSGLIFPSVYFSILLGLSAISFPIHAQTELSTADRNYTFSLYSGQLTDKPWYESFGPKTTFIDSRVWVAALSRTLHRSADNAFSYEMEAQIGKHYGIQEHREHNLLAAVRWHRPPWRDKLNTSAAFGLGISHASEIPNAEVINKTSSEKMLAYWHLELTLGPADSHWQALMRLHHRSTAYGLFGENGGSNALTLGIRYAF